MFLVYVSKCDTMTCFGFVHVRSRLGTKQAILTLMGHTTFYYYGDDYHDIFPINDDTRRTKIYKFVC